MTNTPTDKQPLPASNAPSPSSLPAEKRPGGVWQHFSLAIQLALSLAIAGGILAYLMFGNRKASSPDDEQRPSRPEEIVQIVGPRLIHVQSDTPMEKELHPATATTAWPTSPILPVTGAALASLRPGKDQSQDAWQFATPDLLSAFSDWQKAVVDTKFQTAQLKAIRELNESKINAQQEVVDRMKKLVAAGTDTQKDLVAEKTNLIQYQIQGKKDIHEAETNVEVARRTEATLARQLQQAGLEPTMLRSAAAEGEIVVAEVPERLMDRVKLGMKCEVRFYALPNRVFNGKVSGISPVISKDKRVLNVQFVVKDPQNADPPGHVRADRTGNRQAAVDPHAGRRRVARGG